MLARTPAKPLSMRSRKTDLGASPVPPAAAGGAPGRRRRSRSSRLRRRRGGRSRPGSRGARRRRQRRRGEHRRWLGGARPDRAGARGTVTLRPPRRLHRLGIRRRQRRRPGGGAYEMARNTEIRRGSRCVVVFLPLFAKEQRRRLWSARDHFGKVLKTKSRPATVYQTGTLLR
jgi:hypothetical protein